MLFPRAIFQPTDAEFVDKDFTNFDLAKDVKAAIPAQQENVNTARATRAATRMQRSVDSDDGGVVDSGSEYEDQKEDDDDDDDDDDDESDGDGDDDSIICDDEADAGEGKTGRTGGGGEDCIIGLPQTSIAARIARTLGPTVVPSTKMKASVSFGHL
jgi:U3 small nucleolar RNA-associated protein 14